MMHECVQCTVRNDGIYIPYIRGGGVSGQRGNNAGYATGHRYARYNDQLKRVHSLCAKSGLVGDLMHK